MASGDWGSGAVLRVIELRSVPGANNTIDHTLASYQVRLPSGDAVSRIWVWTPPATFPAGWTPPTTPQANIQALAQLLLHDLCAYEGLPLG